jgi:hypothetical protein
MKIYEKLLTIQKRINGLGKDKATYNYKYVTGDKLLGEIKPMMNDLGLLLKQEVLSIENTRQDYSTSKGSKSEILSKIMMRFTWVDVESGEKDENLFGANGQNDWDKGVGSALTYAERYFLLKYFHIATDEDDIDNDQRKTSAPIPLKEELTELDWVNLEKIFEDKSEVVPAEKFDAIKSAVYGRNPKFYEYTLATLNKL